MASWLEWSGFGSWPGTLVPLSTQVYEWVPAKMLGVTVRWTSIPSRGSRNTPSRFILPKPEISAGLMGLSRLVTETLSFCIGKTMTCDL